MKTSDKILLTSFIIMLVLPTVLWAVMSPNIQEDNLDNRPLREMPSFSAVTAKQFPKGYDLYYADHSPFRTFFIKFYADIQYSLLKCTESRKVIFAKNGWLFYSDESDGDPVMNYKRMDLFTEEELEKVTRNLKGMQKYAKDRGADFAFVIGPGKENVYSEYMPDYIVRKQGISRTEQLISHLRKHTDIKVIFPLEEIKAAKKDDRFLYYQTDTHWNATGGYIASVKFMKQFGINLPSVDDVSIVPYERIGEAKKAGYDIANLSGARDLIKEPYETDVRGYSEIESQGTEQGQFVRYRSDNAPYGKLFMVRDSFAGMMIPVISRYYRESSYIIYHYFQKEMIDAEKPDLFVYETVERYLPKLMRYDFPEE